MTFKPGDLVKVNNKIAFDINLFVSDGGVMTGPQLKAGQVGLVLAVCNDICILTDEARIGWVPPTTLLTFADNVEEDDR